MEKPVAVLISDIHFSLSTLELASQALQQAVDKANRLNVPLIINGDLHDTKANLRGECIKAIMDILHTSDVEIIVNVGNHDLINERGTENALEFLRDCAVLVRTPWYLGITPKSYIIPYYSNVEELRTYLRTIPKGSLILMHQGIEKSHSGEYIQDKSALTYEDVKDFRVISGHYHRRQTIDTGAGNTFDYIGNPFTLNFGEASDPEKGYQILMSDGSLQFVPTNLRKHIIVDLDLSAGIASDRDINSEDLVWVKVSGTKEELLTFDKPKISKMLGLGNFRLDFIPLDTNTNAEPPKDQTQDQVLDNLIDSLTNTSDERKANLKELWRKASCG